MEEPGNPKRTHTPETERDEPADELFAPDMPLTRDLTKEQLYREARRLRIKGRSRMNKRQLASAVARRRHA
jgi:hypothetical protein